MTGKKADNFTAKWAVVTLHPWLPSRSEQIARARAWGVTESMLHGQDVSALIEEDARNVGRTTNWPAKLPERAAFIASMKLLKPEGNTVFFATPLCVGFSEKHAKQTIDEFWGAGMQVYVHSVGAIYRQGDDMTEFLELVGRDANAAHVRASRARNSKSQS